MNAGDTSSGRDRGIDWQSGLDSLEIGDIVAWILNREERGQRGKR